MESFGIIEEKANKNQYLAWFEAIAKNEILTKPCILLYIMFLEKKLNLSWNCYIRILHGFHCHFNHVISFIQPPESQTSKWWWEAFYVGNNGWNNRVITKLKDVFCSSAVLFWLMTVITISICEFGAEIAHLLKRVYLFLLIFQTTFNLTSFMPIRNDIHFFFFIKNKLEARLTTMTSFFS